MLLLIMILCLLGCVYATYILSVEQEPSSPSQQPSPKNGGGDDGNGDGNGDKMTLVDERPPPPPPSTIGRRRQRIDENDDNSSSSGNRNKNNSRNRHRHRGGEHRKPAPAVTTSPSVAVATTAPPSPVVVINDDEKISSPPSPAAGGTVENNIVETRRIRNIRFVRSIATNNNNDKEVHIDANKIGPILVAIWDELRNYSNSSDGATNRQVEKLEFDDVVVDTDSNDLGAGGSESIELLLSPPPQTTAAAGSVVDEERDRAISVLDHIWRLYKNLEAAKSSVEERKRLAICAAACMHAFINSIDDEGLAHLGGLILLYCRVMDTYTIGDSKYVELRAVFSMFDPALIRLKWIHVEKLCDTARERYGVDGKYLSSYERYKTRGTSKVTENPPECLLEWYDRAVANNHHVASISATTFNKSYLSMARYISRQIDDQNDPWHPPKTPYWFLRHPSRTLGRVMSSNGVVYDLVSRLDEHDKKGLICYQPTQTRHRLSDFGRIVEPSTTSCDHYVTSFCFVDHFWYEANVTSVVLIDGTRYVFADNTRSAARSAVMIVRVYRSGGGFEIGPKIQSSSGSSQGFVVTYGGGATHELTDVNVNIKTDNGDTACDSTVESTTGSILIHVPNGTRAIICVQPRRRSGDKIDEGVQNCWLHDSHMTRSRWLYQPGDRSNYREINGQIVATIVFNRHSISIPNNATRANNFSKRAIQRLGGANN